MDYKEAIEILQTLYPFECKMVDGRLQGGFRDYDCETGKAITFAISAMQELQMYKAGKLVLIPDSVYEKQCEELDEYKKIGTLEEVRKEVDKQKEKKPIAGADIIIGRDDDGNPIWETDYVCAECGMGIAPEYVCCPYCGQKLDWSEVEE